MTTLRAGAATDVGQMRSLNEDQFLVAHPLFAVADGMGGHTAGEVASLTAIRALTASFEGNPSSDGLVDAVRQANRAVWDQARDHSELRGMGTTMTALALIEEGDDEVLAIANVGDSRAYLLRDGMLDQLTEDHSVPEELRRAGKLSEEEAAADPRRNVLTRVLGVGPEVEVDSFYVTPYKGDRLLLASDGLFGEITDAEIASAMRRRSSPERVAKQLVELANRAGGSDNITVVVIDVVDDEDRARRASAAVAGEPLTSTSRPPSSAEDTGSEPETAQLPQATAPPDAQGYVAAPPPAEPVAATPSGRRKSRPSFSTIAFVLILVLLVASTAAAVVVYARNSYFVGVQRDRVVIFQGRPGGLLWFQPTLEERTSLRVSDVLPSTADVLRRGKEEPSLARARRYVRNIEQEALRARAGQMGTPTSPSPPFPPTTGPTTGPPIGPTRVP